MKLGDKVTDSITGFTGIVVAITDWIHGCIRVTVQAQQLEDGKPVPTQCFDEGQLVIVKKKQIKNNPVVKGGPVDNLPSREEVSRI